MANCSVLGSMLQIMAFICQSQSCPQLCNCVPQKKSVICQNKHLNSIPNGILADTRLLDLSGNSLRWVEHKDLTAYVHLEELDLSQNIISVLEPGAFTNLQNLHVLRIGANQLKVVPVGAFSNLAKLKILDLSGNKLVILLDFTFQDLHSLQNLEVGDNDLVYISSKAFVGLVGLRELTIEKCNLTSVSSQSLSYLSGLVTLRLRHLGIVSLKENIGKLGGLRNLEIDHWPFLAYISPHAFQGLNLSWLSITNTNITMVPTSALCNLIHLDSLNLSHNPISVLESWALRDLVHLKELHLVGTNLVRVQPYGLGGLQQIRVLNLSNNRLVTLEEGLFHSINTLEMLQVDGNPLFCDCRLLWILQRRNTLSFKDKQPVCAAPVEVQGKAFNSFSESAFVEHFTCQRPKIRNRKLQQLSALEGQDVSFFCQADGEPTPIIFWISPQRRRITTKNNGRIIVLPEGTLEIRNALVKDSGTYICIASNAGGNDTHFAALTVIGLPLNASFISNRTPLYVGNLNEKNLNDTHVFVKFTLDLKTLLVSTAMGCITFFSVVLFCFLLLLVWSRGCGQHKNNFSVDYSFRKVDGPIVSGGQGGTRKFNMKMI